MKPDGKRTLILGASNNPGRFSYIASNKLAEHGHEIIPVGLKKGKVAGKEILDIREKPYVDNVDTLTLYMNPRNQRLFYDYILSLQPRRVIFNPGTENTEFASMLEKDNIETVANCTLVMLNSGIY